MTQRILVTGATGFTGGVILRHLVQDQGANNVIGTGRDTKRITQLRSDGYGVIGGDLLKASWVGASFAQVHTVVHCAAKSSIWGDYSDFYRANVLATRHLLQLPNLTRFIYISSPSVYFDYRDRLDIREDDLLGDLSHAYVKTKYLGEQDVLRSTHIQQRYILRPRAIIGAGDTTLMPRLLKAYRSGRLRKIGDGRAVGDFTSVTNLARLVTKMVVRPSPGRQITYNVTDGKPQVVWDLINTCLDKLSLPPVNRSVPYSLAYTAAALSEWRSRWITGIEPALSRYSVGLLNYSMTLNIDAARQDLDYDPCDTPLDSIAYYTKNREA